VGQAPSAITHPKMQELREEFYDRSLALAVLTAQPRVSATQLSECIEATLSRVAELIGSDLAIIRDRQPRPAAPEVRNPLRDADQ
jgi:hypothetical protein